MKPNGSGTSTDEELWTVKDAAKYMRIHTITMYRYVRIPEKKGGVPKYRFGSAIRIPKQKFMAWLARGND